MRFSPANFNDTGEAPPGALKAAWLIFLLVLLLHIAVIFLLHSRPAFVSHVLTQSIEISLDSTPATAPPHSMPAPPQKTAPPPPPPAPPPAAEAPAAPAAPAPPPETPAAASPPQQQPTPAPATPSEEAQPISSLTRQPRFLRKIEPAYPAAERRAGIQAYVLAEVTIDKQGKVLEVHIIKSGGAAFDTAVSEAIRKSQFTPGYISDSAVPVRFQIPFRFDLN